MLDKSYPKISIITPSYNQGQFLEETIRSVLNQNYPNLEYIIIDGGSTDNSIKIIRKYEKYITYWVSEKDKGQSHAINKGFVKSTGDILSWLNSDDTYKRNALKIISEFFKTHPLIDFVYGNINIIDENSKILKYKKEIDFDYTMGCLVGFGIIIPQQSAFWRRHVLNNIGLLREDFHFNMDGEYFARIAKKCTVKHINKTIADFRLHSKSKTTIHNKIKKIDRHDEEGLIELMRSYNSLSISKYIPFEYCLLLRKTYRLKRLFLKMIRGYYFA